MNLYLLISSLLCIGTILAQPIPGGAERRSLTIPPSNCDQTYAIEMERTLRQLQGRMNQDQLRLAQEYLIMVKQRQDLSIRIRMMDLHTFDSPTTAILRAPLQQFQRCRDTMVGTGTYAGH